MNDNNDIRTKEEADGQQTAFDLVKVSEIARHALKDLISSNKPAIPTFYEKSFYNIAGKMGESELVDYLNSSQPSTKQAALMTSGVASIISDLNSELRQYRSGLDSHGGEIENKHQSIKQNVSPEVWKVLEKDLLGLQKANAQMRSQLQTTENRLEKQEKEVVKLQRKSRRDPLTGAMNRLAMEEDLPNEFARNKRYARTFSLVMADIDHFKNINDTYGHSAGDEILKAFVSLMQQTLREVDVIYRYGGEEFLVLLPETDAKGALLAAERLRKAVDSKVLKHRDTPNVKIHVTSSFGVSINNPDDDNHLDIIKRADQALYKAKNNGRNRVESLLK
ncbi:MAG: GGDEF domain-containing protein [Desulfobulbaceae bacterium]|uniref:diguanylate cyclase n=1 Tax=Candidatus Desulfobia pelagia TaxID=2841692 RepID=A0A8J6TB33_9BACT|nr:GGDEF domain-containing protein [Candidatus Desulfobia pelagia]